MQQKSENYSEFSERTESLSLALRVNLSDLPEKIGISASMFHAYRSGKYPISPKAWRKLESLEITAGVLPGKSPDPPPIESGNAMNDALVEYKATPKSQKNDAFGDPLSKCPSGTLEKGLERLPIPSLQEVHAKMAEMQLQIQASLAASQFTMKELERRVIDAGGTWPLPAEEALLTPGQLWAKYGPR